TLELVWNEAGSRLDLRIGALSLTRQREAKASKGKKSRLPDWPILQSILKNGYPILCRLLSRGRVAVLKLHFTAAFYDPSTTAMVYAAAGTALDALVRLGKDRVPLMDVKAMADFDRETPVMDLHLKIFWRLYRLLGLAVRFAWGFLWDCLRMKKEAASSNARTSDR
ncbi:MAG: hypothetical protein ACI3W7_03130, partial [Oscillospiraceae bacterium]